MSEPTSTPDDPATLYGEDAASGRRFLRWNLSALVLGLVLLALGATQVERSAPTAAPTPAPAESSE